MKKLILVILLAFIPNLMHSQISKGDYLLGGSIYLGYVDGRNELNGVTAEARQFGLGINPTAGYFIIDKLAIGSSLNYYYTYSFDSKNSYNSVGIGPYLKYYFLEKEKNINIFSHLSYNIDIIEDFDNSSHNFKVGAGPIFFINKNIAIETGIYYNYNKYLNSRTHNIYMGAGFSLHLDRSTKK